VPPSPKSQDQDVGFPVELSENCTGWFTTGDAGENVNAADGTDGVDESGGVDVPPHHDDDRFQHPFSMRVHAAIRR